jgi:hypothetical protein
MNGSRLVEQLSPVCRPLLSTEIADALEVPAADVERLALRHRIAPLCRIGRARYYGPRQIRRIYALLRGATTPPRSAQATP